MFCLFQETDIALTELTMNPTASLPGASVRGRTHVHTPGKAGPDLGGCWVGMPPHIHFTPPKTHTLPGATQTHTTALQTEMYLATSDWLIRNNWSVLVFAWPSDWLIRWNKALRQCCSCDLYSNCRSIILSSILDKLS